MIQKKKNREQIFQKKHIQKFSQQTTRDKKKLGRDSLLILKSKNKTKYFYTIFTVFLMISIPIAIAQQNPQIQQNTQAPEIKYFSIYPATTSTNQVQFSYQAIDHGPTNNLNDCKGIKKIDFFNKDTGQIITTRTGEQENCILEEKFDYTPTQEGLQTICARATSYTNTQSTDLCTELKVVQHAPIPDKIEFFDNSGTLNYVKKDGSTINLKLYFKDTNIIDTTQTQINVEQITGTKKDWRQGIKTEGNTITIPNILTSKNFECKIITEITDIFGNQAQKEINCDLKIDDKQPTPTSITTDLQDIDGLYLISKKKITRITAKIDETGIGFTRQKNVYLDLTDITHNSRQQANDCQKKTDSWECYWDITATTNKGAYTITLLPDSTDDYGNTFTKALKQDVDVTENSIEINDVQYAPQYPTENDEVVIMVSIPADIANPKVTIDSTNITKTHQQTKANCEKDGDTLRCTAIIKNLQATSNAQDITITIQDNQRNQKTTSTKIQVFTSEPNTKQYYKFGSAIIQPTKGIDRRTATITEYPIFATINWIQQTPDKDLQIISQNYNCDQKYLTGQPQTTEKNNQNPAIFFRTTTSISNIQDNSIQIPCTATLIIKKGKTIYKQPETETFTLTIPIYNNPLGSISDTIQKKLNITQTEIKNFDKEINDWQAINQALGKLVGIAQTLAQVDAVMGAITAATLVLAQGIELACEHCEVGESLWQTYCNAYTYYNLATKLFVWSPTYVPILQGGYSPLKTVAFIYSCQACKHSGSLIVPFPGAVGNLIINMENKKGQPTKLDSILLYNWDPKKSIHVAQNCYCPNAIEYNLRKEQQIKCIYRNCINEQSKKGLPLTNCDQTLKQQTCLYVDGAAWKLAGGAGLAELIQKMVANILLQLPVGISGMAWGTICDPLIGMFGLKSVGESAYWGGCAGTISGMAVAACSVWGGIQELTETNFFSGNRFNWDQYNADLGGTDYCAQQN